VSDDKITQKNELPNTLLETAYYKNNLYYIETEEKEEYMKGKKKVVSTVIGTVVAVAAITIVSLATIQMLGKNNILANTNNNSVETKPKAIVDTSTWDTTKVTVYTDPASGKKAPIPVGYVASQVTGETGIDTGLVIYEGTVPVTGTQVGVPGTEAWDASCNRNQWVWVPVPDVSRIYDKSTRKSKLYSITQTGRSTYNNSNYEPGVLPNNYDNEQYFSRYNLPGMTKKKLLYEIETELDETIKSIEKYGGFYIGRYENGETKTVKPVVKRMSSNPSASWYDTYANLRTLGANENVKANIIWGCLWDETLQWFRESGAKTDEDIYNSASWGNHKDSENFTYYTNVAGSTGSKTKGSGKSIPTGSTERNKANNIYDMAGNQWEWTLEGYGDNYRRVRGGNCSYNASGYSVGYRYIYGPYNTDASRAYFYIK